jgi:hypothetical protein
VHEQRREVMDFAIQVTTLSSLQLPTKGAGAHDSGPQFPHLDSSEGGHFKAPAWFFPCSHTALTGRGSPAVPPFLPRPHIQGTFTSTYLLGTVSLTATRLGWRGLGKGETNGPVSPRAQVGWEPWTLQFRTTSFNSPKA